MTEEPNSLDAGFEREMIINLPLVLETPKRRPPRRFWPKFWATMGKVPFSEELGAAWYCATDEQTPTRVKGVLFAALAYFVLPTDLIPDFIAGLGFTDDATVLATAMGMVSVHIKPYHSDASRALLRRPVKVSTG
ncbi:MAG: hypothetical protein COA85_04375 [Robiginitomaculum sp.]|nr:MAG: hypothetical protein COA85_04375 [Robiginitomaculum sp.]